MSSGVLVLGVLNGLVIALLAAGFVLIYRASKVLNLAHAQLGAVSSLLLAKLVGGAGWGFWPAFALCVPLGAITGIVVERYLIRPLRARGVSSVRMLILTLGISQLLLAVTYAPFLAPGEDAFRSYPQPFQTSVEVGGVIVTGMSLLTLGIVPALLLGLSLFLSRTSTGKQIRAAANNQEAAQLCGISLDRVGLITWGLAGSLSAITAILNGPTTAGTNPAAVGPSLLFFTMGAAAFGAFVSLPAAVGGALVLGVVFQVVAAETSNAGTAFLVVLATVIAMILLRGKAIGAVFAAQGAPVPEKPALRIPVELKDDVLVRYSGRWLAAALLLVALTLPRLPYLSDPGHRFQLVLILVYAMVGVSLTMLIGWGGQVSLGHFALVGVGGYLAARWIADGWNLIAVVLGAGLVGAAITIVIGLPALRVRGLTLAVTTLGFAVLCPQYLYLQGWLGGNTPFTTPVGRPRLSWLGGTADSQLHVYYLALAVLVVFLVLAMSLRRSGAGRAVLAVRDNERASAAFGVTPMTVKLSLLALSGFIAAAAGVFWAVAWQRMSPIQFGPDTSIAILAVPIIGGLGSLLGAVFAAVLLFAGTFFLAPQVSGLFGPASASAGFLLFLGGMGTVGSIYQFPNGIAGVAQDKWQNYLDRRAVHRRQELEQSVRAEPLSVRDVRVQFGGVVAVDGADIDVRPGEIIGLIGPNGAGKTTLMNVISGIVTPTAGSVRVFGVDVADLPPDVRTGHGLARSFQDATLFPGLTVTETLQLALARGEKTGFLPALLAAPWVRADDRSSRERAHVLMADFGLLPYADSMASELSTGTRRICDLAAQVAARPRVLLLDEPTGGVAQREAEAFGPLVRRLREQLDCSILIIEHDMPLLMALCDRIYAMEAGQVIAEGTPEEIRNDPRVIASYLGSDESAIDRSGTGGKGGPTVAPRQPRRRAALAGTQSTTTEATLRGPSRARKS